MLPVVTQKSIGVKPLKVKRASRRFLNPGEAEVIVALLKLVSSLKSVIEIGVNEGHTAKLVLDNILKIKKYIGIDVLPSYWPQYTFQEKEIPTKPGHAALSYENFDLVLLPNGSFDYPFDSIVDAVFIDGDHGRRAVEHDTTHAIDCVRPGGIIIWHDYVADRGVDVKDVLDEYHKNLRNVFSAYNIYHVENTWLAFMRIPE